MAMTEAARNDVRLPDDRPPAWANSMMKWALTAPGIQGLVGKGVALLTFTGRRTGKTYTVPVSYSRDGDVVTVITKRQRRWWHNFETPTEVELRLAGHTYTGKARIEAGDAETLDYMVGYLAERPIDAKAYGLAKDEITRDKIARIMPHIVLIRIDVTPTA
jgi:deazaflavin-dependent oxidoreductase (nitroreductase family)